MQQSDDKQRVLDATDIVRLIGDHIALRPKGREFVGLCPFHDDHKPSMCVVPHKQIYHCFSCGAGGNAYAFVMNYHKMTFREALQFLAERAGITLTPLQRPGRSFGESDSDTADNQSSALAKADLLGANTTACSFFRAILAHPEHGRTARETIERRGISPGMVEAFQVGASPDKWDGLCLTIGAKGLSEEPFRAVGLLKARESGGGAGGAYDAFRNRLIFPIHDQIGRVVGFGGRRLNDEEEPKYLNSAESSIFDKGSTLYGLHQAAQAIRQSRTALVTEGYTDTIACHQAGITNAVATLGTAMTSGNARVLRRLCDTVVLLFDGDEAGQKAAERAVEVFFAEPVDVKIAMLSAGTDAKDPDELLKREGGADTLRSIIARASDPLEILFSRIRRSIDGQGVSARTRTIEEFTSKLVDLGIGRVEPVRRRLIIQKLGQISGVDWETIAQLIGERQSRQQGRARRLAVPTPGDEQSPWRATAGEHLLGCVMCDPSLTLALTDSQCHVLDPEAYPEGPSRLIAGAIAELLASQEQPSLTRVLAIVDDPLAQRLATRLATEVDRMTGSDANRLRLHWSERLSQARMDLARTPAPASPAAKPAQERDECWDIALVRLRKQREAVGHDPRLVPRPLG